MAKYNYQFNKNNCMYRDICGDFNTDICNSVCQRYIITNFLLFHSQIPLKFQKRKLLIVPECDKDSYSSLQQVRNNIKQFVGDGENLYIFSNNKHNGKTSWATSLMLKYFDQIWQDSGFTVRGVFVSVPMFLMKCKNVMSNPDIEFEQFKETLRTADLVIWDGIATSSISSYDSGVLYAYISERLLQGKSNIYTGEMNRQQMDNALGINLSSCICSNLYPIRFNAEAYKDNDFFADNK